MSSVVRRAVAVCCLVGSPAIGLAQPPQGPEGCEVPARAGAGPTPPDQGSPIHTSQQPAPAEPNRWSLAAYLGWAHTVRSALRVSQPALGTDLTFDEVSYRSESLTPPIYYGGRVGYFPRRWHPVGIEVEFIHVKVYADTQQKVGVGGLHRGVPIDNEVRMGEIVQAYSVSHGLNLLLLNAAVRHSAGRSARAPRGRFTITGRAGLGPTIPHTESAVDGVPQAQYEMGRVAWQLAAGVEVMLWRGLHTLAEYKLTRTRQQGRIHAGTAESVLKTHHGVFGLACRF